MSAVALDSSAILAVFNNEDGAADVIQWLDGALLSAVNYAEIVTKLVEQGFPPDQVRRAVLKIGVEIIEYDVDLADRTGELRTVTKRLGLSLADRACLALAERENAFVLTADRKWAEVGLGLGLDIRLIR